MDDKPVSNFTSAWSDKVVRFLLLGIVLIGIIPRLYLIFVADYFTEDAFITLRYGENFWHGRGLVFNTGEHVLGATSPLWTLITGLVVTIFPLSAALIVINLLALGAFIGVALLSTQILREWQMPAACTILMIATLFLHHLTVAVSVNGMETSLFTLWMATSLYALIRERQDLAIVLAALATLTRPEGAIWSACLFLILFWQKRFAVWRQVVIYAALVLPWIIIATLYYGSPLPQSARAKSGINDSTTLLEWFWHPIDILIILSKFSGLEFFLRSIGILALPFAFLWVGAWVAGTRFAWKKRAPGLLLVVIFFLAYSAFYYLGNPSIFEWYHIPPMVMFALIAVIPLGQLISRWRGQAIVLIAAAAGLAIPLFVDFDSHLRVQEYEDETRRPLSEYLAECTPKDAKLMVEPVGYIGHFSERYIYDMAGLVSVDLAKARMNGDDDWPIQEIRRLAPNYLLLREYEVRENKFFADGDIPLFPTEADRAWFEETYILERQFEWAEDTRLGFSVYRHHTVTPHCTQ